MKCFSRFPFSFCALPISLPLPLLPSLHVLVRNGSEVNFFRKFSSPIFSLSRYYFVNVSLFFLCLYPLVEWIFNVFRVLFWLSAFGFFSLCVLSYTLVRGILFAHYYYYLWIDGVGGWSVGWVAIDPQLVNERTNKRQMEDGCRIVHSSKLSILKAKLPTNNPSIHPTKISQPSMFHHLQFIIFIIKHYYQFVFWNNIIQYYRNDEKNG